LWIELGGDASYLSGIDQRLSAPFMEQSPAPTPFLNGSPIDTQKSSRWSYGGEGSLTFQPEGSDWVFSASVRYGRRKSRHNVHHQTQVKTQYPNPYYALYKQFYPSTPSKFTRFNKTKYFTNQKFAETVTNQTESHEVLDFQVGKDVGLGFFGRDGSSVLSGGVRLARFSSHSDVKVRARLGISFYKTPVFYGLVQNLTTTFNTYYFHGSSDRSFHGVGPILSWRASAPLAGTTERGQLDLDWGITGAILFGRQMAHVSHETAKRTFKGGQSTSIPTGVYGGSEYTHYFTQYRNNPPAQNRSRSVTIPDIGMNVGLSYRIESTKVSFGYRAEYLFGAMDTGVDIRKTSDIGFHGPYATISIGLP
jgi:hypothetical protein